MSSLPVLPEQLQDYKKLYESLLTEHEQLKQQLKQLKENKTDTEDNVSVNNDNSTLLDPQAESSMEISANEKFSSHKKWKNTLHSIIYGNKNLSKNSTMVSDAQGEKVLGYKPYWEKTIWRIIYERIFILILLLLLLSVNGFILDSFNVVESRIVITFYLTMIIGTGGNSGGQSSGVAIQGIASGEINIYSGFKQVVAREIMVSMFVAVILGAVTFFRIYLLGFLHDVLVTPTDVFVITFSLMLIIMISMALGSLLPLTMKRLHFNPANYTFPIFQVCMDIIGTLLVCLVAVTAYGSK